MRRVLMRLLERWRWFAVAIPVAVVAAWVYCQVKVAEYEVVCKVMISDSQRGDMGTSMVMQELGFVQGDMFVENEVVELQSQNLTREVVEGLGLNARYFREKWLGEEEVYEDSWVRVEVERKGQDSSIVMVPVGERRIRVESEEGEVVWEGELPGRMQMGEWQLTLVDGPGRREPLRVQLSSVYSATKYFASRLSVSFIEKNTNAVRVTVRDNVPERGMAFARALIEYYNQDGVKERQQVADKTVEFINTRLAVIDDELVGIEDDAERFKRENQLTDLSADAAFEMERKKLAGTELLRLEMEAEVVEGIGELLAEESEEEYRLLPEDVGISDEGLKGGIARYNELVLERSKLLQSASEHNPVTRGIEVQLRDLRRSVQEAVEQVGRGLRLRMERLEEENQQVEERLTSVPTKEKEYRAIARQQELMESLFLFLMQKREETEIAKLMYLPKARIIEDPDAGDGPVSPRRALVLLLGLMLGCAIPTGLILGMDMFDTKVRTAEEVTNRGSVALLGTFPELRETGKAPEGQDFVASEAMHLVREKVNYLVDGKECPVVMVTSTVPMEGKTVIASRLSLAYAQAGKRILVIGCDLRNPSLHNYLNCFNPKGLSAYLAGMIEDVHSIITHVENGVDVIVGGEVPPNPVQLLAGQRLADLLTLLRREYDYIVLDTPPLGILAEGFSLSKLADACVYVVRANFSRKDNLTFLANLIREERLPNTGVVLNGVIQRGRRYGYGYGYGEYAHGK